MTTVRIGVRAGCVECISASGHSGYADEGEDIVCAGISAVLQTAAVALEDIGLSDASRIREGKRVAMLLQIPDSPEEPIRHDAQVILRAAQLGLEAIQTQYPRYLRVITEQRRCEK